MRRPVIAIVILGVTLTGIVGVVGATLLRVSSDYSCRAVNWSAWRDPQSIEGMYPSARQKIARRAMSCDLLVGQKRSVVRRLLGKPDYGYRTSRSWSWVIGTPRIPIDSETLAVRFSRDRVVRATLQVG